MVIDSRESKGWGTLLQVTKQAPKALVSSLKELVEPYFRPSNQLIAPSPKLDGKHLAYQGLILRVNNQSLIEVANMLHWAHPTILYGECWLGELPRKSFYLYPMSKRWPGNLVQSPTYNIVSQAFMRRALPFPPTVALLVTRKRLTRRSPWARLVVVITIITQRMIRTRRSLSALLMT